MRAVRGEPVPHTPVWFMRQAGRSLPEYLKVREGVGMLESCMDPDLVTEITLQPVRRYGVDAAIFFSDIVLPLKAVGVDLDIKPGVGPVVASPVRTLADVEAIPDLTPEHVPSSPQAVRRLVAELGGTPLIGFAGAPFTVASYLVEGGPSREHALDQGDDVRRPRRLGRADAQDRRHLRGLPRGAGRGRRVGAVQLFDSWAGALTPADYAAYVMPHSAEVLARAGALGVPRIHFGVGTANLLGLMGEAGGDVVGVDWRTPLATAIGQVGDRAVQGNLDPTLVFAPTEVMTARAAEIIEAGRAARGHVFNLGHGVLPSTDPGQLERLTEFVQSYALSGARRPLPGGDDVPGRRLGVRCRLSPAGSRVGLGRASRPLPRRGAPGGRLLRGGLLGCRLLGRRAGSEADPHGAGIRLVDVDVALRAHQVDQLGGAVVLAPRTTARPGSRGWPPMTGTPSRRRGRCW